MGEAAAAKARFWRAMEGGRVIPTAGEPAFELGRVGRAVLRSRIDDFM